MDKQQVVERMCESGVLPVFRTFDVKHLLPASRAFYDAGIACVEYTLTMPNALQLVAEACASLPEDLLVGAGTIMDGPAVDLAVKAGAKFIASPGCSPDMVAACRRHGVVSVVGAATPTEIMQALKHGADVIKVFPASSVGPSFFAEVLGPFPQARLMAAGGITIGNVKDYVLAGAEVVTLLANGLDAQAYATGKVQDITRAAKTFVAAVREAREARGRKTTAKRQ
jgi:2-dehydro-3-deoxyphosphogluconate aldolase/(4S)-4-hydroxy-2-oxoglutarate aldolase